MSNKLLFLTTLVVLWVGLGQYILHLEYAFARFFRPHIISKARQRRGAKW
jgi:hypothetical protein